MSLETDLLSKWEFESNLDDAIDGGNLVDYKSDGSLSYPSGKIGTSAKITNTSNTSAECLYNSNILDTYPDDVSIAGWFKIDETFNSVEACVISCSYASTMSIRLVYNPTTKKFKANAFTTTTSNFYYGTKTIEVDEWFHAVIRATKGGGFTVYINNELDITGTSGSVDTKGICFGDLRPGRGYNCCSMSMDEVYVWERIVEDYEIDMIYNLGSYIQLEQLWSSIFYPWESVQPFNTVLPDGELTVGQQSSTVKSGFRMIDTVKSLVISKNTEVLKYGVRFIDSAKSLVINQNSSVIRSGVRYIATELSLTINQISSSLKVGYRNIGSVISLTISSQTPTLKYGFRKIAEVVSFSISSLFPYKIGPLWGRLQGISTLWGNINNVTSAWEKIGTILWSYKTTPWVSNYYPWTAKGGEKPTTSYNQSSIPTTNYSETTPPTTNYNKTTKPNN